MKLIYIGDIVNTHGIKGELRIISDFKYKKEVFKKGMKLYIGRFHNVEVINTYRKHKNYDMVTLDGLNNINDVIMYKGDSVYINRDDIKIDGYFNEDIIGLSVISNNENKGIVRNILKNKAHDILFIEDNGNNHMVPFVDEFIEKIDLEDKKIYIKEMKGLFDED